MAESLHREFEGLSVEDTDESDITACSWNIKGDARAKDRMEVTTKTFRHAFDGSSLGQADIIALQEISVYPERSKAKEYLPFVDDYKCKWTKEPKGNIYNAIFFKKEKIKIADNGPVDQAFHLLDLKRKTYQEISRGGDLKKQMAIEGKLVPCCKGDNKKMCQEVLKEVRGKSLRCFNSEIAKFKAPDEDDTKSPKDLLSRRMACCCLKIASLPEPIVAISLHFDSKITLPKKINHARLFFDFLEKLDCPVLIAGDFNFDIEKECRNIPEFNEDNYIYQNYELRPLRTKRIDFILLKKGNGVINLNLNQTESHDLQVPPEMPRKLQRGITNHNPLSAIVSVPNKETKKNSHF